MARAKKLTIARKRGAPVAVKRKAASSSRPLQTTMISALALSQMSPYAREALKIFRKGVQAEFKFLAKQGIATVATVDGRPVRAVPQKVGGRFVLVAPTKGAASAAGRGSPAKPVRH